MPQVSRSLTALSIIRRCGVYRHKLSRTMKVRELIGYPRVPSRTAANRREPTVDFADVQIQVHVALVDDTPHRHGEDILPTDIVFHLEAVRLRLDSLPGIWTDYSSRRGPVFLRRNGPDLAWAFLPSVAMPE
jgi:hypothetical protein